MPLTSQKTKKQKNKKTKKQKNKKTKKTKKQKNKKTKKKHLFQFDGNFYGQVDKVAMSSPLGPLMANAFMCHIEEKLENQNKMSA